MVPLTQQTKTVWVDGPRHYGCHRLNVQEQNSFIPRFNSTFANPECRGLQDSANNRKLIKSPEHDVN